MESLDLASSSEISIKGNITLMPGSAFDAAKMSESPQVITISNIRGLNVTATGNLTIQDSGDVRLKLVGNSSDNHNQPMITVDSGGKLTLAGGNLTGNKGGGVLVKSGGTFQISGSPKIMENLNATETQPCNVNLSSGATIEIIGDLVDGSNIGITTAVDPADEAIPITELYERDVSRYFFSDMGGKIGSYEAEPNDCRLYHAAKTYMVTWYNETGGEILATSHNESFVSPTYPNADPVKADDDMYNYTFAGWATEQNGNLVVPKDNPLPKVIKPVSYYANFSKTPLCTLTWMNGDTELEETYGKPGAPLETALPSQTPTKEGHIFMGWNATKGGTEVVNPAEVTIEDDKTYYAVFSKAYTIGEIKRFDASFTVSRTSAAEGMEITATVTYVSSGYTFSHFEIRDKDNAGALLFVVGGETATFKMPAKNILIQMNLARSSSGSSTWMTPVTPTPAPTPTQTTTPDDSGTASFTFETVSVNVGIPGYTGEVVAKELKEADVVEEGFIAGVDISTKTDYVFPAGEKALVSLTVPYSSLPENFIVENAVMCHVTNTGIEELKTEYSVSENSVTYRGWTSSFSPFILVEKENGATPAESTEDTASPFPLLAILAGLGVLAVLKRK